MAPPLYESLTRSCPLQGVPAPLLAALEAQAGKASLSLGGVHVWCTHRVNPAATSFFGKLIGRRANPHDPDAEHDMVLVLHPTHLLVGTCGASRGATVLSIASLVATVSRGSVLAGAFAQRADLPSDDGLTIAGFPGVEGRPGTYFFGMGGPEADACYAAVSAAVAAAKNPR